MASKIIARPQIWYTHLYSECLDHYWFLSWLGNFWPSGGQKHSEGGVSRAPSQRKKFLDFFQHALRCQFETWYIHLVGSATHQGRVSSQSGHPDLLYSQEWFDVIFLNLWPQKLYRAFRFGTLWPISCSYPRHSQLTRHSLMLANGRIRQSLTALVHFMRSKPISYNIHWGKHCGHWTLIGQLHMEGQSMLHFIYAFWVDIFATSGDPFTDPLCREFTSEFPTQRPVMRSFDVSFDLHLNKRLSKQSWGWWFERSSCSLWHRCNDFDFKVWELKLRMKPLCWLLPFEFAN